MNTYTQSILNFGLEFTDCHPELVSGSRERVIKTKMQIRYSSITNPEVKLIVVEGGGKNLKIKGQHASRIASNQGEIAVEQGFKSIFLLDENKKRSTTQSVTAGLNYYGIGPIHPYLHSIGHLQMSAQR